jgi:hypothetical protein
MPLTQKGQEILSNMREEYGPEKGESVFYASRNAGNITGVDEQVSVFPSPSFPQYDPYQIHGKGD